MKIRFGTTGSGESNALILGFVVLGIGCCCWYFQMLRSWSHDLILSSRQSNITSTIFNGQCGLPYDDYRCSVLSMTPNISKYCLNDAQITSMRLLPLLIFVLQLYLIHELFSLSEDCIRFFLYAFWVAAVFIFGVITIVIYHDTCAQQYVTLFLVLVSGILLMLTVHDMSVHDNRRRASGYS